MTYKEQYENAKGKRETSCLTTILIQWNKPGMEVIGEITDVTQFADAQFEDEVKKYLANTDDGQVSFILGADRDEEFKNHLVPGAKFYIKFNGKKPTKSQKVFNEFIIEVWDVPSEYKDIKLKGGK